MKTKTLIIGSGLAGLYAALHASQEGEVIIVTKGKIDNESSSYFAQGGVAAAIGLDDNPELLVQDTLHVGRGLCDEAAVRLLAIEGPRHIMRLRDLGVEFYAPGGKLDLGLEAGHSRRRIVHALGGATGQAIVNALIPHVINNPNITIYEQTEVSSLLSDRKECFGAMTNKGPIFAGKTIIATGGSASLFKRSSNPAGSIGTGMSLAYLAGAALRDIEFVQFHPTALVDDKFDGQLISEAVRGEGAHLFDCNGIRFMPDVHPNAELAPRDELTRAITQRMQETNHHCVYLSTRHLDSDRIELLFSKISESLKTAGYSLTSDLIPVAPAAHYVMGGVQTDLNGQTTLSRLYAIGEVASTGVHGANRLASNSLMECLVFGERAGVIDNDNEIKECPMQDSLPLATWEQIKTIKELTWEEAGVLRTEEKLQKLANLKVDNTAALLATLIARAALARMESRGGHYRLDYPAENQEYLQNSSLSLTK